MWRLVYELLLPGGYLLAFSSPRTGHRMACAIEDAGFIIHPFIGWAYGSGFPKAHAADKAIDRALGKTGRVIPTGVPVRRIRPGADQNKDGSWEKLEGREYQPGSYMAGSPEAEKWKGYAYGGQARKPALEPIYVAQKPFSEKNGALNILKHGVGAVNIDGCRVGTSKNVPTSVSRGKNGKSLSGSVDGSLRRETGTESGHNPNIGRYPANLIHDGSPEVIAQFPESPGQQGASSTDPSSKKTRNVYGDLGHPSVAMQPRGDSGSAARFFECYPFEDRTIFYHSKAGRQDRAGSKHPTVKPIGLLRALVRHVTPPGGTVLDCFAGTGTTGHAAQLEGFNALLIEREAEYVADIERRFGIETPLLDEYLRALGLL